MQNVVMAWFMVALTAAVALSGCSNAPTSKSSGDEANFEQFDLEASATTGILRGVVFDDGIRPLPGVLVSTIGTTQRNLTAETGDDGAFGFDGLEPGTYFVSTSKPGYTSQQASTDVVAGIAEPAILKILMTADPASGPRVETFHLDGYITCSVRPMFLGAQCGGNNAQDVVHAEHVVSGIPEHIQSEMTWKSTQAAGDELSLAIRCLPGRTDPAEKCPEGQRGIVRAEGHSPQIARINRTHAEFWALGDGGNPITIDLFAFGRTDLDVWNEGTIDNTTRPATGTPCLYWPAYFPPQTCMRATGPGLIINQKVDVYTNIFYEFLPDEGWTFLANGPHAVPG